MVYIPLGKGVQQRYVRVCTVRGCSRKPQRTLSQHLSYKHPYLSHEKRQKYLRMSRQLEDSVPVKKARVFASQSMLSQAFKATLPEQPTGTTGGPKPHCEQVNLESPKHTMSRLTKATAVRSVRRTERRQLKGHIRLGYLSCI